MTDNYVLDSSGHPRLEPDIIKWAEWHCRAERHVAKTIVRGITISTVFLGLNHNWGDGPPILWETMIFGGHLDQYQERYISRADALARHKQMVWRVRRRHKLNRPIPRNAKHRREAFKRLRAKCEAYRGAEQRALVTLATSRRAIKELISPN